jgi:uncharacterized protein
MSARPLLVNATELLREPGSRQRVAAEVAPADVDAEHQAITGDITVDVELESTLDDIGLNGVLTVPWRGECRRCLRPLAETLRTDVEERYAEHPGPDDDAFPIAHGQIDLTPMVREYVLLAADEPRLCSEGCAGLCPVCGADLSAGPCNCDTAVVDERWAVLDKLRER